MYCYFPRSSSLAALGPSYQSVGDTVIIPLLKVQVPVIAVINYLLFSSRKLPDHLIFGASWSSRRRLAPSPSPVWCLPTWPGPRREGSTTVLPRATGLLLCSYQTISPSKVCYLVLLQSGYCERCPGLASTPIVTSLTVSGLPLLPIWWGRGCLWLKYWRELIGAQCLVLLISFTTELKIFCKLYPIDSTE